MVLMYLFLLWLMLSDFDSKFCCALCLQVVIMSQASNPWLQIALCIARWRWKEGRAADRPGRGFKTNVSCVSPWFTFQVVLLIGIILANSQEVEAWFPQKNAVTPTLFILRQNDLTTFHSSLNKGSIPSEQENRRKYEIQSPFWRFYAFT